MTTLTIPLHHNHCAENSWATMYVHGRLPNLLKSSLLWQELPAFLLVESPVPPQPHVSSHSILFQRTKSTSVSTDDCSCLWCTVTPDYHSILVGHSCMMVCTLNNTTVVFKLLVLFCYTHHATLMKYTLYE